MVQINYMSVTYYILYIKQKQEFVSIGWYTEIT